MNSIKNRCILCDDDHISKIAIPNGNVWDFTEMQKEKCRSWHSRPYEYRFAFNELLDFAVSKNLSNLNFLDLACGVEHPGYAYFSAISQYAEITALDLDDRLLNNGIDIDKVSKIVGNADNLPFDDNSFDVVVCISAIEHMDCWEKALSEVHRVLKVNGRMILTMDISTDASLTAIHSVDGKSPSDYLEGITSAGLNIIGDFDPDITNAVDIINSKFAMYESEKDLRAGQHRNLKAFRFLAEKI